ncbi:MAG: site-2 protease family protein [Victivallaceae bacterium]|nr:site-2 protease family protein [Victivallaceae bacterium]
MHFFISYLWEDPQFFFMWLLIVVFAICCHEYMHARAALWQGDSTAADEGHLTLNPLRQMGPISLVMLAIMGIAWGQVPVNPNRMRHKYSDALVSFAGPATNLVLGVIFCFAAALVIIIWGIEDPASINGEISNNAVTLFSRGAMLNFVLFVFNLLPVPGFDGWHILSSFFPRLKTSESQAMYFVAVVILLLGFKYISLLFDLGNIISNLIIWGIVFLAGLLGA